MKTYGEVEVQFHAFLTSALDEDVWSVLHPGRFSRQYALDRRLGEPLGRAGRGGEGTNPCP
jgi:hypothetical protein